MGRYRPAPPAGVTLASALSMLLFAELVVPIAEEVSFRCVVGLLYLLMASGVEIPGLK